MKYKVLIADDNPINIKLLVRALVNSDYLILQATGGQEAYDLAVNEKPDLILLDIMMPDMSGLTVCQKLQEREDTSHIPIIFLTAKNESVDKARGLSLGAIDYLTKPFDAMEINARVRNHLRIYQKTFELARQNQKLHEQLKERVVPQQIHNGSDIINELCAIQEKYAFDFTNKKVEICARVKINPEMSTSFIFPLMQEEKQFIYFAFMGVEKDLRSRLLKLFVFNYLRGYLESQPVKWENESYFVELSDSILDAFSASTYDCAFTFSLTAIDFLKCSAWFVKSHQTDPFYISGDEVSVPDKHQLSDLKVHNKSMLEAMKYDLPEKGYWIHYQNGLQKLNPSIVAEKLLPFIQKEQRTAIELTNLLHENFNGSPDDQVSLIVQFS